MVSLSYGQGNKRTLGKSNKKIPLPEQEVDPIVYQNYYFGGIRYKALGNFDQALESFMHCIEMDDSQASVYYEVAMIKFSRKQFDQGISYALRAVELQPENLWYQQLLSNLYLENQQYPKAITAFKRLMELDPKNQDWYFEIATAYLLYGQPRNAIKSYNLLEKHIGFNEALVTQKKNIYLELGDLNGAIVEIEKWVLNQPKSLKALNELSETYLLDDQPKKAMETLEKVLAVDPENGRALLVLSDMYRSDKQDLRAFETVKKAFVSSQLAIDSKMRILISYYELSDDTTVLKQAFELIDLLIAAHPEEAKSHTIAGDYYMRNNQMVEAAASFSKALEYDASRFPIWQQLLILTFDLKKYEESIEIAEAALELFPSQPTIYYLSGLAHLQLDKYQSAIDLLDMGRIMVVANDDLLARFYSSLGDTYHTQEDFSESDKAYEKCLEIKPNDVTVLNNYSYYLSLRSTKLDRAQEMMARCTETMPGFASYEDTYAWVFYKLQDYDNALLWVKKALKSGGDSSPTIVEHYGDILFQLNQKDQALEQWQIAKEMGSESDFIDQKINEKQLYE
jgi:tetratricopeptide (TPR) repeat protein